MKSLKIIKNRIISIDSINKITNAMKIISSSKLNKMIINIKSSEQYLIEIYLFLEKIKNNIININKKKTVIVFCSQQGLCGNFDHKILHNIINKKYNNIKMFIFGNKIQEKLKKYQFNYNIKTISFINTNNISKQITFIVNKIINYNKELLNCDIIYNKFYSIVKTKIKIINLISNDIIKNRNKVKNYNIYIDDINNNNINNNIILQRYIYAMISYIYINNMASEYASRVITMNNASKNSDNISKKLKIYYNKNRQSMITKELIEIIAGIIKNKK